MLRLTILFFSSLLMAGAALAAPTPESFADLVDTLSPAVVNISTTQKIKAAKKGAPLQFRFEGLPEGEEFDPFRQFFEQFGDRFGEAVPTERDMTSLGSGFVIDPAGYIVTNHHVVAQADQVTVTFYDDSKYEAKIVGRDSKTDLALLKIDAKKALPFVRFGNSDTMRVGDWVIAIGNPFGLGGSVSAGIVSARSRNINAGPFDDFIQTDAAINRGNSGGPLFNLKGEVIGVNSAIFSPSGGNIGIGFSIPAALAEPVLAQLREFGRTHRGWLGVKIQHVTDELASGLGLNKARGALVLDVDPASPAAKAGIQSGDVILSFNGKPIDEMRQLPRLVAETKVGTKAAVDVWRAEKKRALSVMLGELKEEETAAAPADKESAPQKQSSSENWQGAQVAVVDDLLREQLGVDEAVSGLLVLQVKPDSPAFEAKLQRGDVISEANQQKIVNVEQLREAISAAAKDGKKFALLRIFRRGAYAFVTIATAEKK